MEDYNKQKRRRMIWWMHTKNRRRVILGLIILNLLIWAIVGAMVTPLEDFKYLRIVPTTQEEDLKYCTMEFIECKNTGDIVIDTLSGTQMSGAIIAIKEASKHYDVDEEIFLGIANAESSFEYFLCNNPWGIMNGKEIRCFDSWEHSVNTFGSLIKYNYLNKGLDTPEKMLMTYVGWNSPHWIGNVKEYWK